jgi:hypothetical protein
MGLCGSPRTAKRSKRHSFGSPRTEIDRKRAFAVLREPQREANVTVSVLGEPQRIDLDVSKVLGEPQPIDLDVSKVLGEPRCDVYLCLRFSENLSTGSATSGGSPRPRQSRSRIVQGVSGTSARPLTMSRGSPRPPQSRWRSNFGLRDLGGRQIGRFRGLRDLESSTEVDFGGLRDLLCDVGLCLQVSETPQRSISSSRRSPRPPGDEGRPTMRPGQRSPGPVTRCARRSAWRRAGRQPWPCQSSWRRRP